MSTSSNSLAAVGRPEFDGASHCLVQLSGLGRLIESLGEETSVLYLEEFEERLKSVSRTQDSLIRLSPDKYCLILDGVSEREYLELAGAKIARTFEAPVDLFGDVLRFDVHTGMVAPSGEVVESKSLIRLAESALRLASASDEPYVIIDPNDARSREQDPSLVPKMERALERQEFRLHYQVKIGAKFRTVVGAEALLRWYDAAEKKILPPAAFIAAAENSSVIEPLTEFVVRSAIGRCVRWRDPTSVAINVTPRLLETNNLVAVVGDALDFYGLGANRLTIEITERGSLAARALENIEAIRDLGVKISIDDFGTGQCSLTYFRDLPADQIKIDRSFVQAMRKSKKDKAIIRGIIDLAHHCQMEVVAEGVEDEWIADELAAMDCDVLQGYWLGKPVDAEEFEREFMADFGAADTDPDLFSNLLQ